MPAITPFDDKLNIFNFSGHRFQLPKTVILPRRDELPKGYTPLVEFFRLLPEYCTELASVMLVATTQVKAHIMEATGGTLGLKRVQQLYSEADDGDGGRVLLARLFNDLVFAGWWICGNLYDGAVVTDLYHIDAAYTRFVQYLFASTPPRYYGEQRRGVDFLLPQHRQQPDLYRHCESGGRFGRYHPHHCRVQRGRSTYPL